MLYKYKKNYYNINILYIGVYFLFFAFIFPPAYSYSGESKFFLKGKLLVSDMQLNDPNFFRTVILVVEHSEEGSLGFVINKLAGFIALSSLVELVINDDEELDQSIPLHNGGPVQPEKFFALHTKDFFVNETSIVIDDICLSPAKDVISSIKNGNAPERVFFALGYAGWSSDQLEHEIKLGLWHVLPKDNSIIFGGSSQIEKWKSAYKKLRANL